AVTGPAGAQTVTNLDDIVVEGATVEKPKTTISTGQSQGAAVTGPPALTESPTGDGIGTATVTGVPAKQIGSAVTVVTGEQLKAQQVRHAADALRSLPGVSVSRTGSPGGLTQIRIRGAEGNHTLVMIDGIDASAASANEFDWSNLLAEDIDRIEVIRGGQSGIYGSKAIGGVINIITKGGKGPLTLSAKTEFGSYGTRDVSTRASGGTDQFWLALSAGYREQNGFNWSIYGQEKDPWDNTTLNVRGGFTIMKGMTLDFVVRDSKTFTNTDPEGFLPQTGLNGALDAPNHTDAHQFLGGVNLRWDMLDGALTHIFKANRSTLDSESFSVGFPDATNWNDSEADTFSYLATYRFATPEFLHSTHAISGFIERKDESFTPSGTGPWAPDGLKRERSYVATLAEYRAGFYDRLFVGGVVRRDENDTFADFTTWNVNASLNLPELGLRPHASTGTSVALPGMYEQFGSVLGTFVGNPNLVPEESFNWDVGVEFSVLNGRALIDVTYFDADLTNKISGFGGTMINLIGESTRKGVEISGRYLVTPTLTVGASYTYLDAKDPNGVEEVRRAPHTGRADLNYAFDGGRGNFNIAAIYNGDMKDNNFAPMWPLPPVFLTLEDYWLVNAAVSYELQPGFEIFGRVENLLDERYEEISGYNTLGIAAYGGIRISLEDPNTAHWAKYR
ncbi:MAG TPA: TonB-dependent receptor, partial [Hyphomicrobium sp.]|uniref:TonB-dependent receptor plug domain-containing protein n=1 Tax=Hyphomicrobium sp. TaxID=82 RepID=UPI002C3C092E